MASQRRQWTDEELLEYLEELRRENIEELGGSTSEEEYEETHVHSDSEEELEDTFVRHEEPSTYADSSTTLCQDDVPEKDELGLEAKVRDYRKIPLEEIAKEEYANSSHAAHCMIFAKNDRPVLNAYNSKATVIMQMRFDGYLGFPGGVVDPGETPEEALAREIEEEMGLLRQNFKIFPDDHIVSHYSPDKDLFLHFFTKELTMPRLEAIELNAIKNDSYGDEVMGLVRVPLYTMSDGYRGLPAFLSHNFVGNSKQQLMNALVSKEILTQEEIDKALSAHPKHINGRPKKSS